MTISMNQLQTDRAAFQSLARKDGLKLGEIRKQALAGLPPTATEEEKRSAVQSAIQKAVDASGDPELQASRSKLNEDRQQAKAAGLFKGRGKRGHGPHGKPPGAAANTNTTVSEVIAKGSSATVAEVEEALNGMDSTNANYATLRSMLATAQAKEQRQQTTTGNTLNVMA
ncbi:MAG: hypothetical protein IPK79_02345 [Vampirovibrionales bacterium]|nr:hypothetical protein [Vampirovibrionales bacterium]